MNNSDVQTEVKTKSIYGNVIQSSPLVIFSSLPISSPFQYSSLSIDPYLKEDSFITLLNDQTNQFYNEHMIYKSKVMAEVNKANQIKILGKNDQLIPINSIVLHLQSPNTKLTYFRLPSLKTNLELDIKLPFLHLQLKPLGHHFMFELGLKNLTGHSIKLRCSTFQLEPKTYYRGNQLVLIHLPILNFNESIQTNWKEIIIPLCKIWKQFNSISYISVHANIRLRRIYFTDNGFIGQEHFNDDDEFCKRGRIIVNQTDCLVEKFRPELTLFSSNCK
ncbi:hypothetical protein CROQUDRAFT_99397 [Cronartium quercuum f. sp. fusiforme G11]|uniref:CFA20 domain-containing protein n=1 Tax=Cronartium quercuum f. sp. fusiforme G11 TaxID=708437 RepID=A0A9P6N789_9BASI|nr:hypothetical protein CROQUDRAFT_99397 [Cronartium quercuum f. sp. fusiforme G11]